MIEGSLATHVYGAKHDWIVPTWPAAQRVGALATTRSGGVSAGAYAGLNLGDACGDDPASVAENRRRLAAFLPSPPIWLRQVHGADVVTLDPANVDAARITAPIADAAVTRERGVVLAAMIADCLPVLFSDRSGHAIGVAHAGWRGLARGVLENAVAALQLDASEIVAWLGPAIGKRAFEVGDDVVDAFDPELAPFFETQQPGKWRADLEGIARRKLARCGVTDVYGGGFCTFDDPARFFSYRRDRDTGRMAALIWLSP
jgi:purine-nucleoside/S-methyl-5'-thioadenosine phosphorylase / adenosine deaminase